MNKFINRVFNVLTLLIFPEYFVLLAACWIFSKIAKKYFCLVYKKYQQKGYEGKYSGVDVAKSVLRRNLLSSVQICMVDGYLTDCYKPNSQHLCLCESVYTSHGGSATGIALHECGHAIQFYKSSLLALITHYGKKISNWFYQIAVFCAIIGFSTNILSISLVSAFLGGLYFLHQCALLMTEFFASRIAKNELEIFPADFFNKSSVYKMLTASQITYIGMFMKKLLEIIRIYIFVFWVWQQGGISMFLIF